MRNKAEDDDNVDKKVQHLEYQNNLLLFSLQQREDKEETCEKEKREMR